MASASSSEIAKTLRVRLSALPDRSLASLRKLRRRLSRERRAFKPPDVIRAALAALDSHAAPLGASPKWFVYELLHHHDAAMASLTVAQVKRLGRGLDGWGEVDPFALYISGPAWRDRRISDAHVHAWARSRDRWWRRVAVVSTVPLNSGGRAPEIERTLAVCDLVKDDRDDTIVKALSWALRTLAVSAPSETRDYLSRNDAALAARVRREVRNKLETGLKNPKPLRQRAAPDNA
jgi:3-methyladenine DNA glycosylase AlkD